MQTPRHGERRTVTSIDISSAGATRRDLLKAACGVAALGSAFSIAPGLQASVFASGSDVLRVGLIGCGGRGRGAVRDAVKAAEGVEITALGDVFPDHLAAARKGLEEDDEEAIRAACKLTDDTCFSGFDAYKRVIESEVDYVLIACPPYFHPAFAEAAVNAGKHVFCEKPGAIDMPGIRRLLAAGEKAASQGTGFLAGTQRRHELSYLETIRRIHEGAIGRPMYGEAMWNNNEWVVVPREDGWSDMEAQLRNWRQNRWLSGDAPGVLVIHYVDAVNWALGAEPVSAFGSGGRQVYTDPELFGNIYDHFECRYTYADGQRVHAMCRNWPGDARHAELVVGTEGSADLGSWVKRGEQVYDYRKETGGDDPSPYTLEHRDLIASIRNGTPLNEAKQLADSTLATIMMREAAYSGREVKRDWLLKESKRVWGPDVPPDELEFGEREVEPVAAPGEWELG
jgi:predicted dehydrogenase